VLFFIGAVISGVTITNPPVPAEPLPGEVAAVGRDQHHTNPIWPAVPDRGRSGEPRGEPAKT
jgi:hypothetical protein